MIDKTAIIDSKAKLDKNVIIGPYCVIGPNVEIGENTIIQSHVNISCKRNVHEFTPFYVHANACGWRRIRLLIFFRECFAPSPGWITARWFKYNQQNTFKINFHVS